MTGWKKQYPLARKDDIKENFHGTEVTDPYRWLEDADSEETLSFVEKNNIIVNDYLQSPKKKRIKERLTEIWDFPKYLAPDKKEDRFYYWKNEGLQGQPILYSQTTEQSDVKVVLDPNTLSKDGTTAVTSHSISKNGKMIAYTTAVHGSDWQVIKIIDTETGQVYPEVIEDVKFVKAAWKPDNSGFFYSKFPKGESTHNKVFFHEMGTEQKEDLLIYERPDAEDYLFYPKVTEDGKYLVLHIYQGTKIENRIYFKNLKDDSEFIRLLDEADAAYEFIGNNDTTFYIKTNLDAPKEKIIAIDSTKPSKDFVDVIPEHESDVIDQVILVNQDHFAISFLHNAHHILKIYQNENFIQSVDLPTLGTIFDYQLKGNQADKEFFLVFVSFLYPPTVYRFNFDSSTLTTFFETNMKSFDQTAYITKQVYYKSKDGTKIPMFLTHKRGISLDGENPTLLYGYGGFNISMTPGSRFRPDQLFWVEQGGIYAVANLRGGGEFGKSWHEAGMLENKQNVFDDFIAAAEYLCNQNYTNSSKLAIQGGSNGGLLVSACMTQRPDLFGAVICNAAVIDMLRYHKFTIGHFWMTEYGDPDNPDHFPFMYAYSPLHNVKEGETYPPMLILVADTDDRVMPAHGKKFAATIQTADRGKNPIFLRTETKAGHGLGKPTMKMIDELADVYTFLFKTLKINLEGNP
ncbi:MAG: prolyl oligopeptidase family serine peptidase [Candidatus Hodarchaeales archaeon]|jgi:prolyl oligopeptidase